MKLLSFLYFLITSSRCHEYTFPTKFRFGVADSANQMKETRNDIDYKENIWEELTQAKHDVQLLNNLGVDFYRLPILWSRILPSGKSDYINPDAIRYYNELIDELLANDIRPLVLMFHSDIPQQLKELGGFLNLEIANYFEDYANVLFEHFGDRVREWITFNEPNTFCYFGYGREQVGLRLNQKDINSYLCGRTLLDAHAKVYRLYNQRYRATQRGRIGISSNIVWFEPRTETIKDLQAADAAQQFFLGWFLHPIFSKEGDYPQLMKGSIEYESGRQGYATSKLPEFTDEEIELIKGSADFLGINHFITYYCTPISDEELNSEFFHFTDMESVCTLDQIVENSVSNSSKMKSSNFRKLLQWIRSEYDNPDVIITANGVSNTSNFIDDCERVNYHNAYLTELMKAIHEDQCNVIGYAVWSFLDNIEWRNGYVERSGLYAVDFNDPKKKRTPKMSAYTYKMIIEDRRVNWSYTPVGFPECDWLTLKDEL